MFVCLCFFVFSAACVSWRWWSCCKNIQCDAKKNLKSSRWQQCKQKKKWNNTVGDGWGKLFTLRERISFTEPSPGRGCSDMTDAGMRGRERLLVQAKHRWDEKRRRSEEELPSLLMQVFLQLAAIKHMHQSHMAQMWTVMNRLLTRRGDENELDKELEWLWQPSGGVGGDKVFVSSCSLNVAQRDFISHVLQLIHHVYSKSLNVVELQASRRCALCLNIYHHLHNTIWISDYFTQQNQFQWLSHVARLCSHNGHPTV